MTSRRVDTDILERIVKRKQEIVSIEKQRTNEQRIMEMAQQATPVRGFAARLSEDIKHGPAIIAEVKKASPSQGIIRHDFEPAAIAKSYKKGGASCISVLTDEDFFHGDNSFLCAAKKACDLPVLRKDFIIDPWQVHQSRAIGADAILLICAIVTFEQLRHLYDLACASGLDCIVEVHNSKEMEHALALDAPLIGINNRNLRSFETDIQTSINLVSMAKQHQGTTFISESGIHNHEHITMLSEHGINAFLVGESLMRQPDICKALQTLMGKL